MDDYLAPGWEFLVAGNDLEGFDALWNLQADWFESPNHCRGGWSGVSRVKLKRPDGGQEYIFLKRQENHLRKTWRHPLVGEPTFRVEARNLMLLNSKGVAAPRLLCYAERKGGNGWQVVLATLEMTGLEPLDQVIEKWQRNGWQAARPSRHALLVQVAELLRRLHALKLVHNALHPKHIFVDEKEGVCCLIDLEKMRARLTRRSAMLRDLDTLNRRVGPISRADRLRFLAVYLEKPPEDPLVRRTWRKLARMAQRRGKRRHDARGGHG